MPDELPFEEQVDEELSKALQVEIECLKDLEAASHLLSRKELAKELREVRLEIENIKRREETRSIIRSEEGKNTNG